MGIAQPRQQVADTGRRLPAAAPIAAMGDSRHDLERYPAPQSCRYRAPSACASNRVGTRSCSCSRARSPLSGAVTCPRRALPGVTCNICAMAARRKPNVADRVKEHRDRLRAQGLRPVQIWVPDVRSRDFATEAHRQAAAVAASDQAEDDQSFIDTVSLHEG